MQHDNLICVLDCGQTVSYHEAGTSLKEPGQGILDQLLRFRIILARCLPSRISTAGSKARERATLRSGAAQLTEWRLSHHRLIIFLWEPLNEVMGIHILRNFADPVIGYLGIVRRMLCGSSRKTERHPLLPRSHCGALSLSVRGYQHRPERESVSRCTS